ncbi:Smr/MutS family protein [Robiginitalea sp. SC105]|uniref:Smr/MutS family protein n=1 Tax=Robiginitalea sp. SC105 TaxID=2762332 RepID=UPI001639BF89|nr:Smr/MutS family protein [Robiginitalea sp. SC105]MBC2840015.1 DNA mismatch repair protein MutS [Robiginitalea sp. SC105]
MEGDLKPGDRVQWVDEDLEGVVQAVIGGRIRVRTTDGFEMDASPGSLVRIPGGTVFPVPPEASRSSGESDPKPGPTRRKGKKARFGPALEVDLHIEKLHPAPKQLDTYEILDLQLETARRQLEFALRKRIQKIVFIHGVGEGVLKAELHTLFRRYDHLKIREADYRTYGLGATEVYIPQEAFL